VKSIDLTIKRPRQEPETYTITASLPIREIVEGLRESTQPRILEEEPGPDYEGELVLALKASDGEQQIKVPLALPVKHGARIAGGVGEEGALAPSPRLSIILRLILRRMGLAREAMLVREPPSSDKDLPGGFHIYAAGFAEEVGGVDFGLAVLDAIVEAYWQKPQRSDADKFDQMKASVDRAYYVFLRRSKPHVERVVAQVEAFADKTKDDRSVSPAFGGIPYGVFVDLATRSELARLFRTLGMYDRALAEYEKIDAAITPAVLAMATNAPAEGHPANTNLNSYRRHLEWTKTTRVTEGIAYCKEKLSKAGHKR
jgi:hypothetical protein